MCWHSLIRRITSLAGVPNIQYTGMHHDITVNTPTGPVTGMISYDTIGQKFMVYDGAHWTPLSIDLDTPVPELIFSTGTVLGTEYYTIEPIEYDWPELEAWCTEAFGLRGDVWNNVTDARWYANSGRLWFRDIKDRDWFVLRWSSK